MTSPMGQWLRLSGYTREQVMVYEAYLQATHEGRDFTCLLRVNYPKKKSAHVCHSKTSPLCDTCGTRHNYPVVRSDRRVVNVTVPENEPQYVMNMVQDQE